MKHLLPLLLCFASTVHAQDGPGKTTQNKLSHTLPAGWKQLPPHRFRSINMLVAGNPKAQCYVGSLRGQGGGVAANVNRWRRQMGKAPLSAQELAKLPTRQVLGARGVYLEVDGTYQGFRGTEAGFRLVGLFIPLRDRTYFVKMIGPKDVLQRENAAFERFLASLAFGPRKPSTHDGKTVLEWAALLRKGKETDRIHAAGALCMIGSQAGAAVPALRAALRVDPSELVRELSAYALGRTRSKAALPDLIRALQTDKSVNVQVFAAMGLGSLGARASSAAPALREALGGTQSALRREAAEALARIGPAGVAALGAALESKNASVRAAAASGLASAGSPAVKRLTQTLGDPDPTVRHAAALALGRIGRAARSALPMLRHLLADQDPQVRLEAARAIALLER